MLTFGHQLRKIRIECGYSQGELAARAELTQAVISKMERGKISPKLKPIVALVTALACDANRLLGFKP